MDVRESIRGYIITNFLFGDTSPLQGDSVSLLDSGIIDSIGVMELVAFLEQDQGLSINDEDLVPENLDSIDNLVNFISRKRAVV